AAQQLAQTTAATNFDQLLGAEGSHHQIIPIPPIDLFWRTSGEQRLSNFLIYQAAYAELVFSEQLWPDVQSEDFDQAVAIYAQRQRRFGGTP
ncbi:MAG: undecaprenyl diphosphate synthase family protein, partial [Bifidobacteriaceae bacterium]|nr:undecaprenyl diphosphate synthase family protein [Bifidobacteriaceae bacterium]